MDDNLAIALVSVKLENRCEKNNDKACARIIYIDNNNIYVKKTSRLTDFRSRDQLHC